METTAQNDGSIESALDTIIEVPESLDSDTKKEQEEDLPKGKLTGEEEEINDSEAEESEVEDSNENDEFSEDDEDEYDTEYEDEDNETPSFTVTVDGNEEQVTLEDLKRGYSGQKYVQQGMEKAANTNRQAEEIFHSLQHERQMLANMAQQFMQGNLMPPPAPPPIEMMQSDPIGYFEQKEMYEHQAMAFNQQMQGMMTSIQPNEGDQKARQAHLEREAEKLREVVPELRDKRSAEKIQRQVADVAEHYGYSPEEIAQTADHRALRILIDAAKYRATVNSKSRADQKAAKAIRKGRPLKSGSKRMGEGKNEQLRRQKSQLRKSGSVDDALGLILGT